MGPQGDGLEAGSTCARLMTIVLGLVLGWPRTLVVRDGSEHNIAKTERAVGKPGEQAYHVGLKSGDE